MANPEPLPWNSREALFAALLLREKVAMAEDIKQRIAGDPAGASLHGLLKHAALALMKRPLLKAALLRDTQVFGEVVQREQSSRSRGLDQADRGYQTPLPRLSASASPSVARSRFRETKPSSSIAFTCFSLSGLFAAP